MKRNEGYTLIELMVVILVATIVASAAATVLLMGMKMHKASNEQASRQINARAVLSLMEDLAAEEEIDLEQDGSTYWKILKKDTSKVLFSFHTGKIFAGESTVLLEGIESSTVTRNGNRITIKIEFPDKEVYTSTVYCRLIEETTPDVSEPAEDKAAPDTASSVAAFSLPSDTTEFLSTNWLPVAFAPQRQNFLSVLEAEEGSTGASLTTGEYFSEWYIGDYDENPGWNKQTPWCACFVSWALEQCRENLMEVPRFAHVSGFMDSFSLGFWKLRDPSPGDLIFFDWEPDSVTRPQHVGVVVSTEPGYVHTIEGNADGVVARRSYAADDPCILGYGVLKWK